MQIVNLNNYPADAKNLAISIGNFDGVHIGHETIISNLKSLADKKRLKTAIITFEPHPLVTLGRIKENFRITSISQKAKLIEQLGVDYLILIDFDKKFSQISAESFIKDILENKIHTKLIMVGKDFIFGHNRTGNAEFLSNHAENHGFEFIGVTLEADENERYSSTRIRNFIKEGDVKAAAKALGRNFAIEGRVIEGKKRGRTIGFPTANLDLGEYIRPKFGVYACYANYNNQKLKAVANIGVKPSFDTEKELLEVYINDFSEDIYGKTIEVELVDFLREEKKFNNLDELKSQIKIDLETALSLL